MKSVARTDDPEEEVLFLRDRVAQLEEELSLVWKHCKENFAKESGLHVSRGWLVEYHWTRGVARVFAQSVTASIRDLAGRGGVLPGWKSALNFVAPSRIPHLSLD